MLTYKQYFPDTGLVQVIALNSVEWQHLINWLYTTIDNVNKENQDKCLMTIRKTREKKEPMALYWFKPWDKIIMDKYKIDERYGFIGLETYLSTYHITKTRYNNALKNA